MSKRRKNLIDKMTYWNNIHKAENRPQTDSSEFYEALEDGQTTDGETIEDIKEPLGDIHGDEI